MSLRTFADAVKLRRTTPGWAPYSRCWRRIHWFGNRGDRAKSRSGPSLLLEAALQGADARRSGAICATGLRSVTAKRGWKS